LTISIVPAGPTPPVPGMPTYVERGGEISCRHPADCLDLRLYGFVLQADRDLLDEFCNRSFNRPSGGDQRWRAAGDHVLLNFVDIPTMGSTDPLDRWLGVCEEQEVAIWVPVVDIHHGRMAWAIPYMFVDSGLALVGGRETYGFPKQLGSMTIPRDDKAPDRLSLRSVTLKTHAPDSIATSTEVVRVTRSGPRSVLDNPWNDPTDAARDLAGLSNDTLAAIIDRLSHPLGAMDHALGDAETAVMLAENLATRRVNMVLLKQFRDAVRPGAACYQAVVEVANTVTQFRQGGLLPQGYEVRFADLDGEPVRRDLGIVLHQTPRVALWLEFDFLVHLGEILWEAHGERL
jgi:hypothetical protein